MYCVASASAAAAASFHNVGKKLAKYCEPRIATPQSQEAATG